MPQVFISHSSKDSHVADYICQLLESQGVACWIAPRNIAAGADWATSIAKAVSECPVFLLIYSANSAASVQVPRELSIAGSVGAYILPYRIDDTQVTDKYLYYLNECHWITAAPVSGDYRAAELIAAAKSPADRSVTVRQNISRKPSKWLLPVILIAAVLIAAVAIFAVGAGGGNLSDSAPQTQEPQSDDGLTVSGQEYVTMIRAHIEAGNYAEAFRYSVLAADKGYPDGISCLAECYYFGYGASVDYTQAFTLYNEASEKGSAGGVAGMAQCYALGNGTEANAEKAFSLGRRAADAGHAEGMNILGYCYANGIGTAQDYATAVRWFTKAAESGSAIAMHNMGLCYYKGNGVEQDYSKALEWYEKGAEKGDSDSMASLGTMYCSGVGTEKDYSKALELLMKAADRNNNSAMVTLGTMYFLGEGVNQDDGKALEWYKKASERGDTEAFYYLGVIYDTGRAGVAVDSEKAAEAGNEKAVQALAELTENPF